MDIVQIVGSLIAISVLALIAGRLFRAPEKLTAERVVRNIARYCPDIDIEAVQPDIVLGQKGKAAVARFGDAADGIAIVTAFGDRVVVRHIPDVSTVDAAPSTEGVNISMHDFTQPTVALALDEGSRETLLEWLNTPLTQNETAHA